jgi:virulence-associated protein VagC
MKLHAERQVRAHRNGGSVSVVLPRWFAAPGDTVIVRREDKDTLSLRRVEPAMKTVGDLVRRMREIGGPPIVRPPQLPYEKRARLL